MLLEAAATSPPQQATSGTEPRTLRLEAHLCEVAFLASLRGILAGEM